MNQREIGLIADLLDRRLDGAMIQKVHHPVEALFVLEVYGGAEGRERLVIDLRRGHATVLLSERKLPNPPAPPAFCAVLRKLIQNGRIRGVEQVGGDRLLRLRIDRMTEAGPVPHDLLLELIPGYPLLFVLDGDDRILAASGAVHNEQRSLARGDHYRPPPAPAPTDRELPCFKRFGAFDPAELFALLDAEMEVVTGLDRKALLKDLDRRLTRQLKKINKIEVDLRKLPEGAEVRNLGELLKPSLHELSRGMTEVRVRDWAAEDETWVTIALDPKLSPQENLDKLFQDARRGDRGRIAIEERLQIERAQLDQLRAFEAELRTVDDDALESLAPRAEALGLEVKRAEPGAAAKKPKEQPRRKCYRSYRSRDGLEIRVGRSSQDNDELTFQHCLGNEWWLHAQDHAGSHVVVKTSDELPEQTLIDAATLAVQYSKARSGGKQAVSYTRRKNVSKFKGARPGQVQLKSHKTILVRFEDERLERLESGRSEG
ncbi:MAG: NFACT family protein [Planctomycetes bacterium]|nr:NFACT family protein [Planctomycetota bacterium]